VLSPLNMNVIQIESRPTPKALRLRQASQRCKYRGLLFYHARVENRSARLLHSANTPFPPSLNRTHVLQFVSNEHVENVGDRALSAPRAGHSLYSTITDLETNGLRNERVTARPIDQGQVLWIIHVVFSGASCAE